MRPVKSSLTVIRYLKLSRADASDALAPYTSRPGARREIAADRARTYGWHSRAPDPVMTATLDTKLTPCSPARIIEGRVLTSV